LNHPAERAALKTLIWLPNGTARICKWLGLASLDPYGRRGGRRARSSLGLRNDFNRLDRRVFGLGCKGDAEFSIGHFHWHCLDIGAFVTASLRPDVKVLELLPLNIEGKDALTGAGNAIVGLRKIELREILAVGNLVGESSHAPMLAREQAGILGSGNHRSGTTAASAGTGSAGRCASVASRTVGQLAFPDRFTGQLVESNDCRLRAARSADNFVTVNERRFAVTPHWQDPTEISLQVALP
jgi:hypothetical protein